MMCPPGRGGRNYYSPGYGYDATTIWFQYTLCQQESIPSLACWLFTSNWNQGDFGQYYLYDNLLGDDGLAGLDGDNVLPLLLLGGGLGGGSYGGLGGGVYGGHGMQRYRREAEVDCDGDDCEASRKRRDTCSAGTTWNDDTQKCEANRKRRETCSAGTTGNDDTKRCEANRKRRDTCSAGTTWNDDTKKCEASRKRRETDCPSEIYDDAGNCEHSMTRRNDDVMCEYNVEEGDHQCNGV